MKSFRVRAILVLAVYAMCAFLMLNNLCLYTPDSARYLSLALSIAGGEGYRDLYLPGNPVHVNFPPLYPALLVPAALLAPEHLIVAGKILTILIGVCALAVLHHLLGRLVSPPRAVAITALTALNPLFILHAAEALSESTYLGVSSLSILLLIDAERDRFGRACIAGLAAGAACLTRYSGISLILAGGALFLLRRDWRRGCIFLVAAAVIAPWGVREYLHVSRIGAAGWGYGSSLAVSVSAHPLGIMELLRRAGGGALRYVELLGPLFLPFLYPAESGLDQCLLPFLLRMPVLPAFIARCLSACAALCVLVGFIRCAKSRERMPLAAYLVAHGAVLVAYPVREIRYLIPLSAFILLCLIEGMGVLVRCAAKPGRPIAAALTCIYALGFLVCDACLAASNLVSLGVVGGEFTPAARFEFDLPTAAGWLREHTPPDSVVLCERAELFLLSGRKVVSGGQYAAVFGRFERCLDEYGVAFIVGAAPSGVSVHHRSMAYATRYDFEKVAEYAHIAIHRVIPRKSPRAPYPERYEEPISLLERRVRERPGDANAWRELGYFQFKERNLREAARSFRRALDIDPGCPVTWFNLGSAHLDMERFDEALAAFEKALSVRTSDLIEPLVRPSMRLARIKKENAARPGDPGNYGRLMEAATLYSGMKEYAKAVAELEAAASLQPTLAEPHLFMGRCYALLGSKGEARRAFLRALALDPSDNGARREMEACGGPDG